MGVGERWGGGWRLFEAGPLLTFFCLWDGRLFEVGANLSLSAYSNKYGIYFLFADFYSPQWTSS